jgi:hypothetical protein
MHVDGHVDLLAPDQLGDGERGPLGEVPVGPAGKRAVQVPAVLVGLVLRRRVVDEGERVRPLLQRARLAIADPVPLRAERRRDVEERRVRVAQHALQRRAPVRPGDDEDPPARHPQVLEDHVRHHRARRLVGMGPAEDQHRPARHARVEQVHRRVHHRAGDAAEVRAERHLPGQPLRDDDGLAEGPQRADVGGAPHHQRQRSGQQREAANEESPVAHPITSLDVQRPEDERDDRVRVHDVVRQARPRRPAE